MDMISSTEVRSTRKIIDIGDSSPFNIDEGDYNVVRELLLQNDCTDCESTARKMVKTQDDEDFRICTLKSLNGTSIRSLPPSIGELKCLQRLILDFTDLRDTLPEEIGDLVSLETLSLWGSPITSLPSSIGKLQNLKKMDLQSTDKLLILPDEIGNLVSLEVLILIRSGVTSLPSSIGKLQNLKRLQLSYASNLLKLPEEVGNLGSLQCLTLAEVKIPSLPVSIGRLRTLELLSLDSTRFSTLPTEIGNLTNLIYLDLENSNIKSLPASFHKLVNLRYLDVQRCFVDNVNELKMMVKRLPLLLGIRGYSGGCNELEFALACNRARYKISAIGKIPGLWPYILGNAKHAYTWHSITEPSCFEWYSPGGIRTDTPQIRDTDAIHQLLEYGRYFFVEALVGRSSSPQKPAQEEQEEQAKKEETRKRKKENAGSMQPE